MSNCTSNTTGEGTPEVIRGQTASDSEYEIVLIQKTSGDTTKRWIPTSVVSSVGNHCLFTAAESTIRLNVTREEDGAGRSTTVGNVAHPDATSRLKTTKWKNRGELLHEGVVEPGSNVIDLVHDLLRKRKTSDTIGWQHIASQMRASNIPMELVGNVVRRRHIQKGKQTLTPKPTKGRRVQLPDDPPIGSLIKPRVLTRDRHTMAQPYNGMVIISVVAVIIVFLAIFLMTSLQSYHRCPGAAVPWDA